jgi:hypothetical protein
MTRTKIALFAIPIIAGLVAVGAISGNSEKESIILETSSELQNTVLPQAYAEKPVKATIPITVDEDYGDTSTFDNIEVTCKISTRGDVTTVNSCEATAIMDKTQLDALINGGLNPTNWELLLSAIQSNPLDFDKILVEYEVGLLTNEIDAYLGTLDPVLALPEDYEEKSVTLEFSIQNNEGVETEQTKVVIAIEY